LEKVANFFYKEVMCRFGPPERVVVDGGADNKTWTGLLLKCYNIRKITVTLYHAAPDGVIEREYRPIANVLSKLTACSYQSKEMWIDHLPAVHSANRVIIRCMTRYSQFRLIFGHDAVPPIELEKVS